MQRYRASWQRSPTLWEEFKESEDKLSMVLKAIGIFVVGVAFVLLLVNAVTFVQVARGYSVEYQPLLHWPMQFLKLI